MTVGIACLLCSGVEFHCKYVMFVCLLGQRERGRAEVVAGTGNEGTDLALGLALGLAIRTGENPDTGHGAEVRVPVGTVKIGRNMWRGTARNGETST